MRHPAEPPSSPSTPHGPAIATVLVVDDEPPIRGLLRQLLSGLGFDVIEASDSDGALRLLKATKVDALIVDVRLTDRRSGLEVLQFVRGDHQLAHLPVIVLTGALLTTEEEELIRRLSAYVFYKREGIEVIAEKLHHLIGWSR